MKKILFALLSCIILALPASGATVKNGGDIKIEIEVLKYAVNTFFDTEESRKAIASKYHDILVETGGFGLTAKNAWHICGAGVDINTPQGRKACESFINYITRYNNLYYPVCDEDKKFPSDITKKCEDVFDPGWGDESNVEVNVETGINLAKAYASYKYKDDIVCSKGAPREESNDDFISCRSLKSSKKFYEFRFADLKETDGDDYEAGVQEGICRIVGLERDTLVGVPAHKYNMLSGTVQGTWEQGYRPDTSLVTMPFCKNTTKFFCENDVASVAKKFERKMVINNGTQCVFAKKFSGKNNYVNEYGAPIDNMVFSNSNSEIQLQADGDLEVQVHVYVARTLGADLETFECGGAHNTLERGFLEDDEDVITCYINGKRVDFLFDDLIEANKRIQKGSQQAMNCIVSGGQYSGESCTLLGKTQCDQIAKLDLETCPECETAKWNESEQICELPNAEDAKKLKNRTNVAIKVGGTVVALVLTAVSGGSALALAGGGVALVGNITKVSSDKIVDNNVESFINEMNRCILSGDSQCAEDFLSKNLQTVSNLRQDALNAQAHTIDEMLSRLVKMLPGDSQFLQDMILLCGEDENGQIKEEQCPFYPNGLTVAQWFQRIGTGVEIVGNVMMIVGSFVKTSKTVMSLSEKIEALKHTGWIRQNGQWLNQTTGQVVNKLPKGAAAWNPNPNLAGGGRWFGWWGTNNFGFIPNQAMGEIANLATATANTTSLGVNTIVLASGATNLTKDIVMNQKDTVPVVAPDFGSKENTEPSSTVTTVESTVPNTTPGGDTNPPKDGNPGGGDVPGDTDVFIDLDKVVVTAPKVERKIKGLDVGDTTPKMPTFTATPPAKKPSESTTPVVTPTVTPTLPPAPVVIPTAPTITPTVPTVPVSVAPIEPLKNIEPVKTEKKRNTAAIAIGSVLAVGATGGLVGGLVAKNKRDERREANKLTTVPVATPFVGAGNQLTNEMNALLGTAGGVLGYVNGKELKLIPLPTVVNTYSTIVQINVRAVAVVDYNGYKLPYYVEPTAGSWRPLLGIGQMGGWFNTYPSDTGITTIDSITNTLNQILSPANVSKFVGGAAGSAFPVAAPAAFQIINAEFPNGVVQTYNGTFTPADQALYNSNYNKMKNAL